MGCKDEAHCYTCNVVCVSVGHNYELCYNTRPIEMLFWVCQRNRVLGGGLDPKGKGKLIRGGSPSHCEVHGISDISQSYSLGGSTLLAVSVSSAMHIIASIITEVADTCC